MHVNPARPAAFSAAVVLGIVSITGCGGSLQTQPHADTARSALEGGLAAWVGGGKPGAIEGQQPVVHFVDSIWQSGRKLSAYTITDAESPGADRRFTVKLSLTAPDKTDEVNYVVIGTDPIWIYRLDDYERMLNMDNNPVDTKKTRRGR